MIFSINSISNIYALAETAAETTVETTNDSFVSNEISEEEKIEIKEYETIVDNFIEPIFGDRIISSCEYIYNLDDSADYIYVKFENGGYAIYAKQTMEMLEYSLQDSLPYANSNASKYYAGPANYFYKSESDQFFDSFTGNQIDILKTEVDGIANQIRESIVNDKVTEYTIDVFDLPNIEILPDIQKNNASSKPDIDTGSLIAASTSSGYLIPNFEYFTTNPTIGNNFKGESYGNGNSGTCGPVAAQILLGYNNYYNDRRIIEDRFLNGYDDATNTVINPERNPNYCTDPMSMTRWTTGTRSEDTGTNSFYSEIITRIMKPKTSGSTNKEVKNGIADYLSDRLPSNGYSVNYTEKGCWFGYSPVDSTIIKNELDTGRPIIISMDSNLGGSNHFVVGYGYQDYTYADGSGTYEGYVVHFGWTGSARTCVWVNSAWCDGYVSLKVNHTHNYYTVGTISGTNRTEYKCSTCGHRTDAAINMAARDRYVERSTTLSAGEYQDYYVTFKTAGNKLIQTFGPKDARIYLYDSEYNLLAQNDDYGYSLNALLNYTAEADTPYILRVKFFSSSASGDVKIGITPASIVYSTYEDIWNSNSSGVTFGFSTSLNATRVITFTPTVSGTYTFKTNYTGDTRIDTYLYVVDPYTTSECLYNDDGAGNLQALITTDLVAGRTYFIVVSTYNITSTSGALTLSIQKVT